MASQNHEVPKPAIPLPAGSTSGGPGPDLQKVLQKIQLCLEELDGTARDLVRMKFAEGLTYRQLSERTGLSVSAVGCLLHEVLQRVAAELDSEDVRL